MPKNIPQSITIQKNLISSTHPWLILLDIFLPDATSFYLVNNNEDVTFQSRTYTKCRFKFIPGEETMSGEIPIFKLGIADVQGLFEFYIQKYRGGIDSAVTVRLVNTADLAADYSSLTIELSIQQVDREGFEWLNFTLGAPNPMIMELLQFIFSPNHCNWVRKYKGYRCGYTGTAADCTGTLEDCRAHNNSTRFGGHFGLNATGFKLA